MPLGESPFYRRVPAEKKASRPEQKTSSKASTSGVGEVVDVLKSVFGAGERGSRKEGLKYVFFEDARSRRELFEYCRALAEYVHHEKIADLVVADRSTRPVTTGLREYWHAAFPTERLPNMYYVSPKGFKAREDVSADEEQETIFKSIMHGEPVEGEECIRSRREILDEFTHVYPQLVKDKDKPVLLFDTCIHTGHSIAPVKRIFEEAGFTHLLVGAVQPSDKGSIVKTDYYITTQESKKPCYPFDQENLVMKSFEHVHSLPTRDHDSLMLSTQLRAEIKRIMQEQLVQQKKA